MPSLATPLRRDAVFSHSSAFQIARVILDLYRLPSFTNCPWSAMNIHFAITKAAFLVITVLYWLWRIDV
jgi:hypothetical protein